MGSVAVRADAVEGDLRGATGHMMGPIQRVNVDFASPMLEELDSAAKELNISRQAVIKTLIRQALDQHYMAIAHHRPRNGDRLGGAHAM